MSTALLERLLESCELLGLLKGKKKQRTDSTHVLASVRDLTLLELVGETMRMTLNELAVLAPEWLQEKMKPEWVKRYGRRFDGSRLPKSSAKRRELALETRVDGYFCWRTSLLISAKGISWVQNAGDPAENLDSAILSRRGQQHSLANEEGIWSAPSAYHDFFPTRHG